MQKIIKWNFLKDMLQCYSESAYAFERNSTYMPENHTEEYKMFTMWYTECHIVNV